MSDVNLEPIETLSTTLHQEIGKAIIGQKDTINLMLVALLSGGHILLEPHKLGQNFMVIATQNPIEQQGTYPLPEAQLDRFLFKHVLDYPSREQEIEILERHGSKSGAPDLKTFGVKAVATPASIKAATNIIPQIRLGDDVSHYIVDLVRGTRSNPLFETGASPRAAAMIAVASRAQAALKGRDYVIPDDVKAIALPALRHRAILSATAEIEGRDADAVIQSVMEQTEAPR